MMSSRYMVHKSNFIDDETLVERNAEKEWPLMGPLARHLPPRRYSSLPPPPCRVSIATESH